MFATAVPQQGSMSLLFMALAVGSTSSLAGHNAQHIQVKEEGPYSHSVGNRSPYPCSFYGLLISPAVPSAQNTLQGSCVRLVIAPTALLGRQGRDVIGKQAYL